MEYGYFLSIKEMGDTIRQSSVFINNIFKLSYIFHGILIFQSWK